MIVGFYLSKPKLVKSPLDCVCNVGGRYKKAVGISVLTEYWDSSRHLCREVKTYPEAKEINKQLKQFSEAVAKVAEQVGVEFEKPTNAKFWQRVQIQLTGGVSRKAVSFVDYFAEYVERRKLQVAIRTTKKYKTTLRKLEAYEKATRTSLSFRDINLDFYTRFERWLKGSGYSVNYFGTITNCIKVVYRDARDIDGLHNFHETEKRGFSSPSISSKAVYLTNEELQRIAEVEITPESLIAADVMYSKMKRPDLERKVEALNLTRNKFILGAYTALRVSDFNSLRNVNIFDGYFRITTKKTAASVVIPIHPTIRNMIKDGFDITAPISEQKINKHIKEVARLAGITYPVEATKSVKNRAVVGWWPKCDVITTHTARRSAATNMYKAGIPTISIMRITGHTTEKSFMKYIKITNEENAELMARNKFFL